MTWNGILLIVTADLLLAVSFVFQKLYGNRCGNTSQVGALFLLISNLAKIVFYALLCLLVPKSASADFFAPFSVSVASVKELAAVLYTLIGFHLLEKHGMTLYTLFLMTGGMTLPYLYGVVFLKEPLTKARLVGLLLIILSTVFYNLTVEKNRRMPLRLWGLCGAVFILNGLVSIFSKIHQIELVYPTADTYGFAFWSAAAGGVFSFVLYAALRRKKGVFADFGHGSLPLATGQAIGAAVVGGVSYLMQLFGAAFLPATVLYPAVTGGSILCCALADKLFFKASFTVMQGVGLVLAVIGTCLFL